MKQYCDFTTKVMHLLGLLLLYVIACMGGKMTVRDDLSVPCSYFDSVNLTNANKLRDRSYRYDGEYYSPDYVGTYGYKFTNSSNREPTTPHLRGCLCHRKTCIRLCCKKHEYFDRVQNLCVDATEEFVKDLAIFDPSGTYVTANIYNSTFGIVYGTPCINYGYFLDPAVVEYDGWKLYRNGSLVRDDDYEAFTKNEYCLAPIRSRNDTSLVINPYVCFSDNESHHRNVIFAIAMLFSVPFMIVTVFVYALIPELRNLHGKSLICYLTGLSIGYIGMAYIQYTSGQQMTLLSCTIVGFGVYFFLLASFFWLSVISFDLWWNFRGTKGINKFNDRKKFFIYSLYAWGAAGAMLVMASTIQNIPSIPEILKPAIGNGNFCWLDTRLWIQVLYFFGPISIIICFNTVMFILTALKIHRVQTEMSRIMAKDDSQRNLDRERDKFGLFLRLFIIMGVTWSMEIISWALGEGGWIFYITDFFNAIQGFLIFALFVLKKKVKNLILKRPKYRRNLGNTRRTGNDNEKYRSIRGIQTHSRYSSKTNSSAITMSSVNHAPAPGDKNEKSLIPANNGNRNL